MPFVLHTRVVTGTGGGPEKTILNSPRFLQAHGYDCACLFMRPPQDAGFRTLEAKAQAAGAQIIGVDDRGPFDRSVVRECVRICRERNVDIWHAHDYKSNAIGLLVQKSHPMQLVTTAHGWVRFTWKTPLYYWIDRVCMKRYQQVICVSQDLYDRCRSMGVPEDRLRLIDNAIVADDYDASPPRLQERATFSTDNNRLLLGACGRLSEEKGFDHLISAVGRLVRSGLNVGLVIAGEGHLRSRLQNQIDELNLQDRVQLTGFLKDPRQLYRAIDVFVLSSLREGLPNVVLEAMASGRAVVTTRINGIPRLVTHGENGMVIPCGSEAHLFSALRECLEDADLRQKLAAAGRATVEGRFSFQQRMQKIVDVYRSLPSGRTCQESGSASKTHELETV
ncbi:MAG: glycosyltransferase family 4 protein [Planctomycetaceae bacterium]